MQKFNSQSGFTLMEIVVSTTLFAIVFVALLSLFNYTLKINRKSEALRQATQGMRNFMEYLVKEIRNGQLDYGVVDPGGTQLVPSYPIGPCTVPATAASAGTPTYADKENRLGLVNTDSIQECIFLADNLGNYAGTGNFSVANGTLVLQKSGLPAQILNPSNTRVEKFMLLIRPTKDPYVLAGGLAKISPVVSIFMKFVVTLPTGEQLPIYYQTSATTNQYDVPNQ